MRPDVANSQNEAKRLDRIMRPEYSAVIQPDGRGELNGGGVMKLRVLAVLVLGMVCFSASAEGVKPYVRVSGGGALLNDSNLSAPDFRAEMEADPGYVLGAAAGLAMDCFRAELEFGYQKNDLDKLNVTAPFVGAGSIDGKVEIMTLMMNGYVDFKNKSIITPYLMAGIGAAKVDVKMDGESDDDVVLAGQIGAGLAFAVSGNVSIDTEYRYFMTDDPNFDGTDAEISGHRLQVGVRYTFN